MPSHRFSIRLLMKTTQIYAEIVDSKKIEAVNLVDSVFD